MTGVHLRQTNRLIVAIVSASLLVATNGIAAELYVDDDDSSCGDRGPCYSNVQDAVVAAADGDTILVLAGTYAGSVWVERKRLILRSESGPDVTVLDGRGNPGDGIVIFEGADLEIDGFTIQNYGSYGIVLFAFGSARGVIRNNVVAHNSSRGGIGILGGLDVEVDIQDNRLIDNFGGVRIQLSDVAGSIRIRNNVIAFNRVAGSEPSGAGIHLRVTGSTGGPRELALEVLNNTIFGNQAVFGGGIAANASNLRLLNNILFGNTATQTGDDLYLVQEGLTALVKANVIGDGQFSSDNISLDPELVDPANGDFHLRARSPAIDAGLDDPFLPEADFENDDRVMDGDGDGMPIVDIGADEFFANSTPHCSGAAADPQLIWPPNGRFNSVSVTGVTDPDGDPVAITIDAILQDEPVREARKTRSQRMSPDGDGLGNSEARVRAERSGRGDGRVYHVRFVADDGLGGTCSGRVAVCVPHGVRDLGCGDQGMLFDSTSPSIQDRAVRGKPRK